MDELKDFLRDDLTEALIKSWSISSKETITITFYTEDINRFIDQLLKTNLSLATQTIPSERNARAYTLPNLQEKMIIERICTKLQELDEATTICKLYVDESEYKVLLPIFYAL